jgi:hypothetical protein
MDPTPLEQDEVVADATKLTEVPTVLLLAGLVTFTPANAETLAKRQTEIAIERRAGFFIMGGSPVTWFWDSRQRKALKTEVATGR